jgi:hypothetical protein
MPEAAFFLLLLVPPAIFVGLTLFGKKLFPTGTFAIGQGEQRHKRLKTVRGVILTSVLLPILVAIVGKLMP